MYYANLVNTYQVLQISEAFKKLSSGSRRLLRDSSGRRKQVSGAERGFELATPAFGGRRRPVALQRALPDGAPRANVMI
jgi:hypothetical protein